MWLCRNGVPFDVAFRMPDLERAAFCIILANMERPKDKRFNFDTMDFPED